MIYVNLIIVTGETFLWLTIKDVIFVIPYLFGHNNHFIEKNVKRVVLDRNIYGINEFIIQVFLFILSKH